MGTVIEFERIKDVTGWPIWEIREYIRNKGWKNFRIKYDLDGDIINIIKLPNQSLR